MNTDLLRLKSLKYLKLKIKFENVAVYFQRIRNLSPSSFVIYVFRFSYLKRKWSRRKTVKYVNLNIILHQMFNVYHYIELYMYFSE